MIHTLKNNIIDNTFGARLDPRSKIIFTILFIINVLMLQSGNFLQIVFAFTIIILMIFTSGHYFGFYLRKIVKIYPMILLTTFLLPFTNTVQLQGFDDSILITIGQVSVYKFGLIRFIDFNLKAILILTSTLVLTTTTPYELLLKSMESIKLPPWLLAILTFLFRLIFLLSSELERMHLAYTSRHIYLSYLKKIKIYSQMFAVYFIRILERSDRTYQVMISRGFSGKIPISSELNWQIRDSLLVGIGFIFTVLVNLWN